MRKNRNNAGTTMRRFTSLLLGLRVFGLVLALVPHAGAQVDEANSSLPRAPGGSSSIPAGQALVTEGKGWMTDALPKRQGLHLEGAAVVSFDLKPLNLSPGLYRMGFVGRTGTRWNDAQDQIRRYEWRLVSDSQSASGDFHLLSSPPFQPVRAAGEPDAWGNWYGTLEASLPVKLQGNEKLEISNRENHGGVVELWVQPVAPSNAVGLALRPGDPNGAFGNGETASLELSITDPSGKGSDNLAIHLDWLDLATGETRSEDRPVPSKSTFLMLDGPEKPGVYRLRATVKTDDKGVENPASAQVFFAQSAARSAAELPDNWPINAHVDAGTPPLPGFRWYRYFAQWSKINPARDQYDWAECDAVFKAVRSAGGRLFLASDGTPLWASAKGKAGMPWEKGATAYPPDDWSNLKRYLDTLLSRYSDKRGTLGALELCNEANTAERWMGTPEDLVAMAKVYESAVLSTGSQIKVVGVAASAGDQRGYIEALTKAGLARNVQAYSAHFYEELMSPGASTPINNLPKYVAALAEPLARAGANLPLINSECGIEFARRIDGVPPTQEEINKRDEADPHFNKSHPWMLGSSWRPVSERRAAAAYVAGIVQLMGAGVNQSFVFSQLGFMRDGAPSLPWVALGQLGGWLDRVDFSEIHALSARYPGTGSGEGEPEAQAWLIGKPGGKQVIIAFGFLRDSSVGRSKYWQPWLDPRPLDITTDASAGVLHDLYDRDVKKVKAENGRITVPCGEEPVCVMLE